MLYPAICGAVLSAFVCAFVLFPRLSRLVPVPEAGAEPGLPAIPAAMELPRLSLSGAGEQPDLIRESWQDLRFRDDVLDFFEALTGSEYIASCVLINAEAFDIPPGLAFALSWEESRFNPRAVNRFNRNESVDRGLFQLNSKSFPRLSEEQFFDVWLNAYYGLGHLRLCLDRGGSLVAGLAMYNAGTVRVTSGGGAPKQTLDYISRILTVMQKIEGLYREHRPVMTAETPETPETSPAAPRLTLLSPALRFGGMH
jgi:hypothetical protein